MVAKSACSAITTGRVPCTAPPLKDGPFCLWHDPAHAGEVAEGRRLGGLRRRRETAVLGAYDFEGPGTVPEIRRLVEVAVIDALYSGAASWAISASLVVFPPSRLMVQYKVGVALFSQSVIRKEITHLCQRIRKGERSLLLGVQSVQ